MTLSKLRIPKEFFIDGSLALKRNVLLRMFLLLLNIFMVPLSIFWFLNDHWILGSSQLLFLFSFNIDVILSIKNRPLVISYPIVISTLSLTFFLAVFYIGFSAVLWLYPIVIAIYFVIPLKLANYSNFIIVTPIAVLLFMQLETSLAIRYCASMGATLMLGIGLVNTIVDLQKQLVRQSRTDPLTGAYNRRHMDTILNALIEISDKEIQPNVILMLDIDYFKNINDKFGHEAGDIALQDLVILLKEKSRKSDDVFRMGGEEFILLLRDTEYEKAKVIAESLRQSIEKLVIKNSDNTITVSIGVSLLIPEMNYSQWLKGVDSCLYEAKRLGRNRVI